MKYIRTKDGRILKIFKDNVSLCQKNDGVAYYGKETIDFETSCFLPKTEIIKQADTIEELCDEVVIKTPNENPHIFYILYGYESEKRFKHIKDRLEHFKECEIYGAIWTDKGLIYVAKMNDKGELELL